MALRDELILYHYAMSGSSQKLRLALAEKALVWKGHQVDLLRGEQHADAYRLINPSGFVPTLFHGDLRLCEVAATMEYLDEAFPEVPLRPNAADQRHRMRCWVKYVDEVIHPANGFLSYAIAGREMLLRMKQEEIVRYLAAMPNARDRRLRRIAIESGLAAPEFVEAVQAHDALLTRMETALGDDAFLAGPLLTIADLTVLPYIKRLTHIGIGAVLQLDRRPRVARWLLQMTTRPSYKFAVLDYLPQGIDDGRPVENAEAMQVAAACLAI